MSFKIERKFLSTHVTCIKFYENAILAGIGGNLHFLRGHQDENLQWNNVAKIEVFESQNIYGIIPKDGKIIIFGGKNICILNILNPNSLNLNIEKQYAADDWILDVVWLRDNSLALLTANNAVQKINLENEGSVLERNICIERCILYSGMILNDSWSKLIILAGTVFQEVVIWSNEPNPNSLLLHRLKGHKGVIFSVNYDNDTQRISTTSDDRTVRLWKVNFYENDNWSKCDINLTHSIFAHTARVWRSHFLSNQMLVSIGEDSLIGIWDEHGKCVNQWSGHQGGCIWSLDCSGNLGLIATGGSDGGINLWPIIRNSLPVSLPFEIVDPNRHARNCVITEAGYAVTVTNLGELMIYIDKWILCFKDERFYNYVQLHISPNRRYLALGSIFGHILICKVQHGKVDKLIEAKPLLNGRIYSLLWITNSILSSCGPEGEIVLWQCDLETGDLVKTDEFILPKSKERWFTCCCIAKEFLLCGDRGGSIHLFSLAKQQKESISSLNRIHGYRGTSDVKYFDGIVISTGRDGTYRQIVIEDNKLNVLSTYKLQMEWAASILHTEPFGCLIVGFLETYFVLWSTNERRPLLKLDCGGGHRSWDCFIDDKSGNLVVAFIKEKIVKYYCKPLSAITYRSAMLGYHPKPVNSSTLIPLSDGSIYIASGGEDTTLRLFKIEDSKQISCAILRRHLSSIRTVSSLRSSFNSEIYIASAGGRGQMVIWRLVQGVSGDLTVMELISHTIRDYSSLKLSKQTEPMEDSEIRYMDIQLMNWKEKEILILAGCSDGVMRLLLFKTDCNKIIVLKEYKHHKKCILKVLYAKYKNKHLIASMATDGKIAFWHLKPENISEPEKVETKEPTSYILHDLGINCWDSLHQNDCLILATGSDDCSIAINVFRLSEFEEESLKCSWINKSLHTCQITGTKIFPDYLFCSAMDQRISIFRWSLKDVDLKVEFITQIKCCVPDLHGLLAWTDPLGNMNVYLYGIGVQIFEIKPQHAITVGKVKL